MDTFPTSGSPFAPKSFRLQQGFTRGVVQLDLEAAKELVTSSWRQGGDCLPCMTGTSRTLQKSWKVQPESFTTMVVADLLMGQPEHRGTVVSMLGMLEEELTGEGLFHFFKDHARLPADADCTALGLSVLLRGGAMVTERAHAALDRIAANVSAEGVIETYFDPTGERSGIVDSVVCANALYLAYQLGRGEEFQATLNYLYEVIVEGQYLDGTRYYHSPDTFLYFASRFVGRFRKVHGLLLEPLRKALRERQGTSAYPMDLAQRAIAARWLGDGDQGEAELLGCLQWEDGCWGSDSLFRYGRKKVYFGSKVMMAAFALRALRTSSSADSRAETFVPSWQPRYRANHYLSL